MREEERNKEEMTKDVMGRKVDEKATDHEEKGDAEGPDVSSGRVITMVTIDLRGTVRVSSDSLSGCSQNLPRIIRESQDLEKYIIVTNYRSHTCVRTCKLSLTTGATHGYKSVKYLVGSKVCQLQVEVFVQHTVLWLDVSMKHTSLVKIHYSQEYLSEVVPR